MPGFVFFQFHVWDDLKYSDAGIDKRGRRVQFFSSWQWSDNLLSWEYMEHEMEYEMSRYFQYHIGSIWTIILSKFIQKYIIF